MKICIIAIDGLEYNLVKSWRLKGLQQEVFGYVDVSDMKTLLTPIIWASFITGVPPSVHGIKSWWGVSSNSSLNSLFYWIRYNFPLIKNLSQWRLRKIASLFGVSVRPPQKNDLTKKGLQTIFDFAEKPVVIDVPSYNESADVRSRYSKAMDGGIKEYEKEIWTVHKERIAKIMHKLDTDFDLFMAWIDLGDQMGHLWMGKNKAKMLKTYISLESLVQRIKEELSEDTLCLIVSDHGMESSSMKEPMHSNRAFFSFNIDVGWRPNSIMDYANFIKDIMSKKEEV